MARSIAAWVGASRTTRWMVAPDASARSARSTTAAATYAMGTMLNRACGAAAMRRWTPSRRASAARARMKVNKRFDGRPPAVGGHPLGLETGVAGAVNHRVDRGAEPAPIGRREPAIADGEVAFDHAQVGTGRDVAEGGRHPLERRTTTTQACEHRDPAPPVEQVPDDFATDEAGGSRDENAHGRTPRGHGVPGVRSAGPRQRSA